MEKLKDPAMLLSVANSIGIVGTTAYFYKQLETMRLDMIKMSQTIQGMVRKLSELEKGDQNKSEALHTLTDQVKRTHEQLEDIPSLSELDNLDVDLGEIVAVLEENNIKVERPSQNIRLTRRSGDRKATPRRDPEPEERDRRDSSRRSVYSSRPSSGRNERTDSTRDIDSRVRPTSTGRDKPSRQESRTEPNQSYDDDADLIDSVRRQQTRN